MRGLLRNLTWGSDGHREICEGKWRITFGVGTNPSAWRIRRPEEAGLRNLESVEGLRAQSGEMGELQSRDLFM